MSDVPGRFEGALSLSRPALRLRGGLLWLDRNFAFTSAGNMVRAALAMVLLGAVVALYLGQDANWDLRNYHLYNGYAWLQGRLQQDLAPAQLQSYFSPMLDVLQYLALSRLPGPLAGLLFGMLHALVFVPLAAIAWQVLDAHPQRARLAPLFALAGMCSAAFLSEFAGTMADATTALPVLVAVALVLRAQQLQKAGEGGWALWVLAGAMLGLAVAFKLTNAIYALALGLAALSAGAGATRRLGGFMTLAMIALVVFAIVAGPWYWQVWQAYGNPLFPQFNGVFHAPLAQPVSIGDTRWLPRGVLQQLTWPLLFTLKPWRVSEIALFQCVWALLYLSVLALLLRRLVGRRPVAVAAGPAIRPVLVFFVVAYLLWQLLFGIQRYLVVLELLAPLLLWFCVRKLVPSARAGWLAGALVAGSALFALFGWADWGHEGWTRSALELQQPAMDRADRSVVLLVGDEPQSWRITLLPREARYVSVASNFPESAGYRQRVAQIVAERSERYALLPAAVDRVGGRVQRIKVWVRRLGWDRQPGCTSLRWLVSHGLRAELQADGGQCLLVPKAGKAKDVAAADRATQAGADAKLAGYGLAIDQSSCQRLQARIGRGEYPYLWCAVVPRR